VQNHTGLRVSDKTAGFQAQRKSTELNCDRVAFGRGMMEWMPELYGAREEAMEDLPMPARSRGNSARNLGR
jgi:hypothetical protein